MTVEPADPEGDLAPLLALASGGDDRAWRRILDLYAPRVFAMAKSRVRRPDLAEEITQAVFAKVAEKMMTGAYTDTGKFEAWLFRVAMNRVRDEFRAQKRRPVETMESRTLDAMQTTDTPRATMIEPPPQRDALRRAIEKLPDADRTVVELRHHGGMGFKQIAELLDEPTGTVLARHHRALKKLKSLIETMTRDPRPEPTP